jgi:ribosomal protein S18 acetylase RimI-like enzyme
MRRRGAENGHMMYHRGVLAMRDSDMTLRKFERTDNPVFSSWFDSPDMRRWLESPWTEAELGAMEAEENGRTFVLEADGKMVALIGCYLPTGGFKEYGLSVVAVAPEERRKGYGKKAIAALLARYGLGQRWLAFCEPENTVIRNLLQGMGWTQESQEPNSHNFLTHRVDT